MRNVEFANLRVVRLEIQRQLNDFIVRQVNIAEVGHVSEHAHKVTGHQIRMEKIQLVMAQIQGPQRLTQTDGDDATGSSEAIFGNIEI